MGKDAVSVKFADADLAGSMSALESLRQNAAMRHDVMSQGAASGGARVGGLGGGLAGLLGGGALAAKGLAGSKLHLRGKAGLGALASLLGGGVGGTAGASVGRAQGARAMPALPDAMTSPVTTQSAPAVSAYLAKQAGIGGFLGGLGGKALGGLGRAVTRPGPGPGAFAVSRQAMRGGVPHSLISGATLPVPRQFSLGRTAATAGGLGVGGAGAGLTAAHANDAADNTVGMSMNPLTWGRGSLGRSLGMSGGPSEEDVYRQNQSGYTDAAKGIRGDMDSALAAGDHEKWQGLNAKFMSGDFGAATGANPLNWRMGGLNPFAAQKGRVYQDRMLGAQQGLQSKYDTEMTKAGPRPGDQEMMSHLQDRLTRGDLLPEQANAMQSQLEALRKRLGQAPGTESDAAAAIKSRMTGAGMRFTPHRMPGSPGAATAQPYAGWNLAGRPQLPGYMTGQQMMPADHRPPGGFWDAVVGQGSSPFAPYG